MSVLRSSILHCVVLWAAAAWQAHARRKLPAMAIGNRVGTCAPLKNHGSFSSVQVAVGTPPQKLQVVADTGSDALTVRSCAPDASNGQCFQYHNSSTFLPTINDRGEDLLIVTQFGSGPTESVLASDVASVGNLKVDMTNELLLMVASDFDIGNSLEGIIGLGIPRTQLDLVNSSYQPKGFLEMARIHRFSICFNLGQDGTLRLGSAAESTKKKKTNLASVSQNHWSLSFVGMRVGADPTGVGAGFCDVKDMQPGQQTPCAAIVDSGTTMVMAPPDQLEYLQALICDQWPRCSASANCPATSIACKAAYLQNALMPCEDLSSLPLLKFHVQGADGGYLTLHLLWNYYTVEQIQEQMSPFGIMEQWSTCSLAFQSMEMHSVKNGPVWIFGSPFFYQYQIVYNLDTKPPSIHFSGEPCSPCEEGHGTSLVSRGRSAKEQKKYRRKINDVMAITGPTRVLNITGGL